MSGPKTEEQISAAEKKKDDAGKKACRRASNPAEDFSPRTESPQRRTRMLGGVFHAFDIEDRGFITKADWLELSDARRVLRQTVRSARISVLYTHWRDKSLPYFGRPRGNRQILSLEPSQPTDLSLCP